MIFIILGCTAEYGFHDKMQSALGVPIIDAVLAPFKHAEFMADLAQRFGWRPSPMWGSEAPSQAEITAWNILGGPAPVGARLTLDGLAS